jgi:hypothetical protein
MPATVDDMSNLLEHWAETKEKITQLEKDLEKYKRLAARIMSREDSNIIKNNFYTLKRRELFRETLSKQDVPDEIWRKYSKSHSYSAFYLSKTK